MPNQTRRTFVKHSAGAAAGMTVFAGLLADRARADAAAGSHPVLAYVGDPGTGEISLMSADGEITVRNPRLAADIAGAARR